MNALIEFRDVTVSLGGFETLQDVNASFPDGRVTVVVGRAGAGKSTLLKTAAGLIQPDLGQILFRGRALASMSRAEELAFRRISSFVFQDAALWANQSIFNNLALPLAVHEPSLPKTEINRRVSEMAKAVGYDESLAIRPAECSAGEQKLISIARAMMLDPELVFMDEPTASMDSDGVEKLNEILHRLKEAGRSLIIVSHDPRLIADIADQLCVVAAGKVIGFGAVEENVQLAGSDLARKIMAARAKNRAIDGSERGI